ncbi:LOW QUALITY PROTEIN: SAFB-like transcription modulator [Haliotis rubra]|uniref:LOW QUALITY PROTEIN: SAFB-like transcription modulator n=1 Tax=Haliotis rubra TaxID=36100 RepID=UPI001EE584A5|nr:LOW QUALITY PROTEIN: SAFB-like transcription modulator [Haliotis rubra]
MAMDVGQDDAIVDLDEEFIGDGEGTVEGEIEMNEAEGEAAPEDDADPEMETEIIDETEPEAEAEPEEEEAAEQTEVVTVPEVNQVPAPVPAPSPTKSTTPAKTKATTPAAKATPAPKTTPKAVAAKTAPKTATAKSTPAKTPGAKSAAKSPAAKPAVTPKTAAADKPTTPVKTSAAPKAQTKTATRSSSPRVAAAKASTATPKSADATTPSAAATTAKDSSKDEITLFEPTDDSFDVRVDDTQVNEIDADLKDEKGGKKAAGADATASEEAKGDAGEAVKVKTEDKTKPADKKDEKKPEDKKEDAKPAKRLVWFVLIQNPLQLPSVYISLVILSCYHFQRGFPTFIFCSSEGKEGKEKETKSSQHSRNLWVSGLTSSTRATDLKSPFSKYGKVIGAKVVTNARSPGSRCYGFVTMSTAEEASKCIQHLHRTELHGKMISVERAKNEPGGPSKAALLKKAEDKKPVDKKEAEKKDGEKKVEKKVDRKADNRDNRSNRRPHHDKRARREARRPEKKHNDKQTSSTDAKRHPTTSPKSAEIKKAEKKTDEKQKEEEGGEKDEKKSESDRSQSKDPKDVLSFEKIEAERKRQRLRQKERALRDEERRRLSKIERQRARQKQIHLRAREEAIRLEREKDRLRLEREKLERERIETERLRLERERLERERLEQLRLEQRRLDDQRRAAKRPFDSRGSRHDDDYWSSPPKRSMSDRLDNYGDSRRENRIDRSANTDRKVERYDRRDSRTADTRGSNRGRIEDRNDRRDMPVQHGCDREERHGSGFGEAQRLDDQRRAAKRPFDSRGSRHDDDYWSSPPKRSMSDRLDNYGDSRRENRFDRSADTDRKVERNDRRDSRTADTRGSNRGRIEHQNDRRDMPVQHGRDREERHGSGFGEAQRYSETRNTRDDRRDTRTHNRQEENRRDFNKGRDDDRWNTRLPQRNDSQSDWKSDSEIRMAAGNGRDPWQGQSGSGVQDDRCSKNFNSGSGMMSNGANSNQRQSWGNNSDRSKIDQSWGHGVVDNSGPRGGGGDRWMGGVQSTHSDRGGGFNIGGSGGLMNNIGGPGLYMATTPQNPNLMMMGSITRQPEARYLQQGTLRRF